jgi:hypothetical protein
MTFSETTKKRLPIILLTTPLIGLMIATPIFLSTGTPIVNLPWVALMISSFSLVSWLLNITFLKHFPSQLGVRCTFRVNVPPKRYKQLYISYL